MTSPTILVVDDEEPIRTLIRSYLEREGYAVVDSSDGPTGVAMVQDVAPDVVVLDIMLPGMDGIEACRRIRTFSDAYILMLTARTEEFDRVIGLSVGADDYLTKPFSPRELVARVKALLRRPRTIRATGASETATAMPPAGLAVDVPRRTVTVDGEARTLTATEFDILAVLTRDPGVVVSRQALLDAVWGFDFVGDDHVVDVHVANLRRKLGDDPEGPRFIETVRGVGYRLHSGS